MLLKKMSLFSATASIALVSTLAAAEPAMLGNGFYAGIGGAYVFGASNASFGSNPQSNIGSNGFGGQILAGYDALISSFYIGGQGFGGFYGATTDGNITATTGKVNLNYLWGGIAEPGYHLASNANLFLRAGVIGGNVTVENTLGTNASFNKIGYAVGAGTEIGVTNNISIRGQYTFYGLANEDIIETSVSPFFGEALMSVVYHFA